jgi:predicted DsbA family dithiol-disulfide isomerase
MVYRQLATALEASDVDHKIHWHPFELNPNMPPEG